MTTGGGRRADHDVESGSAPARRSFSWQRVGKYLTLRFRYFGQRPRHDFPPPKRAFNVTVERQPDAAFECWLREEVVPVAAAMRDEPGRAIPIDRVFDELRQFHEDT